MQCFLLEWIYIRDHFSVMVELELGTAVVRHEVRRIAVENFSKHEEV